MYLQVGAWTVWLVALLVEHKADLQKKAFVRQCAKDKVGVGIIYEDRVDTWQLAGNEIKI